MGLFDTLTNHIFTLQNVLWGHSEFPIIRTNLLIEKKGENILQLGWCKGTHIGKICKSIGKFALLLWLVCDEVCVESEPFIITTNGVKEFTLVIFFMFEYDRHYDFNADKKCDWTVVIQFKYSQFYCWYCNYTTILLDLCYFIGQWTVSMKYFFIAAAISFRCVVAMNCKSTCFIIINAYSFQVNAKSFHLNQNLSNLPNTAHIRSLTFQISLTCFSFIPFLYSSLLKLNNPTTPNSHKKSFIS